MNQWRWSGLAIGSLLLSLLLLSGCTRLGNPQPAGDEAFRGAMERLPDTELDFVFVTPGFRLANFERYFVEPLAVTMPVGTMDALREQRMREVFEQALEEELDPNGPLQRVQAPGPGVLVVRPQVVDLRRVPEGFDLPDSRFIFRLEEGRMTLVAEILDGQTGRVLARAADLERDPEAFPEDLSEWQLVEIAFRRWVRRFQERMDTSAPVS